jgi:hypothetical protein
MLSRLSPFVPGCLRNLSDIFNSLWKQLGSPKFDVDITVGEKNASQIKLYVYIRTWRNKLSAVIYVYLACVWFVLY